MEIFFFIKRFTLTVGPILIMLLKLVLSKIQNVKVGAQAPEKKVRVPGTMRDP